MAVTSGRGGAVVPIDNDVYDRMGDSWWDETNPLNVLLWQHHSRPVGLLPGGAHAASGRRGCRAAGSGHRLRRGFLAEEFARLGCDVVGVDPSSVSIEAARRHAAANGLEIDYRVGSGEQLPAEDSSFDVVYCCDVLEHVSNLDRVVSETARVMKPGAMYLFDTINRTLTSKVVAIKVMQEWSLTRIAAGRWSNPGRVDHAEQRDETGDLVESPISVLMLARQ
jgi:2-polyprenyl-6-hydroxyphenyl methylase/3-demethylubiquinone-9 3-methyltransferase